MTYLNNVLVAQWYSPKLWGWFLWPAAVVFSLLVKIRKYCYSKNIFRTYCSDVPVIIVGNITVGGTGKTPLVIYLVQLLQQLGYKPGIVTRGYKGRLKTAALIVADGDPKLVGDEAILLAQRCNCPVVVSKRRVAGVKILEKTAAVNIIICDDGLQHYALERDIEISVVDAQRGFGNGHSLPMGPLREMPNRLESVDITILNGSDMQLVFENAYALANPIYNAAINGFKNQTVHAVAGIGNPERFFQQLRDIGIKVIPHAFPDHHEFAATDIEFADELPILMTEKDAVKCRNFANSRHWVVPANAVLTEPVITSLCKLIKDL